MNIVNSATVRSRIISTLSENNYTLSGRICLPSCPRLFLPSPQGGVSNRSIIFPPRSSGHCLLNRTPRRYPSAKSLRERSSPLLEAPILCLLLPLLARPQMRNRCLRISSLFCPIKPLKGIEQFYRMPRSDIE